MVEDKPLASSSQCLAYHTNALLFNGNNGQTTSILICVCRERVLTYAELTEQTARAWRRAVRCWECVKWRVFGWCIYARIVCPKVTCGCRRWSICAHVSCAGVNWLIDHIRRWYVGIFSSLDWVRLYKWVPASLQYVCAWNRVNSSIDIIGSRSDLILNTIQICLLVGDICNELILVTDYIEYL